jgi:hypothetical protein
MLKFFPLFPLGINVRLLGKHSSKFVIGDAQISALGGAPPWRQPDGAERKLDPRYEPIHVVVVHRIAHRHRECELDRFD